MSIPAEFMADLKAMPQVLRELLEAELAAGNRIEEVSYGFPAPPVGACFRLARRVSTRERASGGGIDFRERNSSTHSGEFTDAKRHFFILEPPAPEPEEPDSDAIRAARAPAPDPPRETKAPAEDAVARFAKSMQMDHEKWHDGTGYDLDVLETASPKEKARIEAMLVARGVRDWRDVEALAAIDSPQARALLVEAAQCGDPTIETAVMRAAPELVSDGRRTASLVAALETAEVYGGLTQALLEVEEFHPPQVVDALFRGVLNRDGATAGHFAAMLMYLHGKTEEPYDFELRPFFLQFQDGDRREHFRELCERIGVDAGKYLNG